MRGQHRSCRVAQKAVTPYQSKLPCLRNTSIAAKEERWHVVVQGQHEGSDDDGHKLLRASLHSFACSSYSRSQRGPPRTMVRLDRASLSIIVCGAKRRTSDSSAAETQDLSADMTGRQASPSERFRCSIRKAGRIGRRTYTLRDKALSSGVHLCASAMMRARLNLKSELKRWDRWEPVGGQD